MSGVTTNVAQPNEVCHGIALKLAELLRGVMQGGRWMTKGGERSNVEGQPN